MKIAEYQSLKFKNPTYKVSHIYIRNQKIYRKNNKTISLINEYYDDFVSFRHLKIRHYFGIFTLLITLIYAMYIIYSNQGNIQENLIMVLVVVSGLGFSYLRDSFDNNILKNYNNKYRTNFSYLWQAQDDWLKRKFGENYNPNELFKKFDEWKTKRGKYLIYKYFPIGKYTYHSDAKPRINALLIAFLSLNTVIAINMFRPIDFNDFLINIIQNFFYFLFLSPFIAILFYFTLFLRNIITDLLFYFYDIQKSKNSFSEEKYKKFMGLLAQKIEVNLDQ